jgi:hypothetical protein
LHSDAQQLGTIHTNTFGRLIWYDDESTLQILLSFSLNPLSFFVTARIKPVSVSSRAVIMPLLISSPFPSFCLYLSSFLPPASLQQYFSAYFDTQ